MVVLVTCKNEEDPIKNEAARVFTTLYQDFFRRTSQSGVSGWIWPKFELIQSFMHMLVTYKNEEDLIKCEGAGVFRFHPLYML